MDYNQIFSWLSKIILSVNVIVYSKGLSSFYSRKTFRIFFFYIGYIFLFQIVLFLFWLFKINNIFLSHFYFIIQFVLLSFFYRELFKGKNQKRVINAVMITIISIIIIQYIFTPGLFNKFNLSEIVLTSVPLIMYSIIHFYNILGKKKEYVYINSGVLLYLSGSTLLFVAGNYIVASDSILNKSIWIINSILFVVYQILIFVEWRKSFYKKKIQ